MSAIYSVTPSDYLFAFGGQKRESKPIKIRRVDSVVEREPLIRPFRFKGGSLSELWQTVSYIESASGLHAVGLATQSVLWSDAAVFAACSETEANELMYALTEKALQLIDGQSFVIPFELLDRIIPELYAYGKEITGRQNLRKTFVLNALVSVDNALWLLYAKENGLTDLDQLVPDIYRRALSSRNEEVASISLISYDTPKEEIIKLMEEGCFILKIVVK